MKICAIRLIGHPGVGNLSLAFTDSAGEPFSTVVLAGENGCGKTAILEAIQKTFEAKLNTNIGKVEIDLLINPEESARLHSSNQISSGGPPDPTHLVTIKYNSDDKEWTAYELTWTDKTGTPHRRHPFVFGEASLQGIFRTFFSEASVNFNPTPSKSVTTLAVDEPTYTERSGKNLAQQVTQLLIDVRATDAEELADWVRANPGEAPPEEVQSRRLSRFTKAFDYMFTEKRFKGVSRRAGNLHIEFEENGRTSEIDTLSTGEKQIVFRAGFLLKSLKNTSGALILIDEPELSLHPDWQSKVLDFYKSLLSDSNGLHPQIILSTHSPFIVHASATARTIILEKGPGGTISEMIAPAYPIAKGAEAIQAFNLEAFIRDAKQPLLVLTEGESDEKILEEAWRKLRPNKPAPFELRPALGKKNINITLNDQELFNKLGSRMIVGLFDFDDAYDQWKGVWAGSGKPATIVSADDKKGLAKRRDGQRGWALLLPVPDFRVGYASQSLAGRSILSIEFLFKDEDIPPQMLDQVAGPLGTMTPRFKASQKMAFAAHVQTLPADAFQAFEPLFACFERILDGSL